MNAPLPEDVRKALESVTLDDKYTLPAGRAFMSGIQALVRLPMLQRQRDAAAGLNSGAAANIVARSCVAIGRGRRLYPLTRPTPAARGGAQSTWRKTSRLIGDAPHFASSRSGAPSRSMSMPPPGTSQ